VYLMTALGAMNHPAIPTLLVALFGEAREMQSTALLGIQRTAPLGMQRTAFLEVTHCPFLHPESKPWPLRPG